MAHAFTVQSGAAAAPEAFIIHGEMKALTLLRSVLLSSHQSCVCSFGKNELWLKLKVKQGAAPRKTGFTFRYTVISAPRHREG